MYAALATTGVEWQPASSHRDVYPTRCGGMHCPLRGLHDCPQTRENGGMPSMHCGLALQIHSTIASESLKHSFPHHSRPLPAHTTLLQFRAGQPLSSPATAGNETGEGPPTVQPYKPGLLFFPLKATLLHHGKLAFWFV
jgi:hypothetical protein